VTTSSAHLPAVSEAKARTAAHAERLRSQLIDLSHTIHANPELSYEEHAAAGLVAETLRNAGFAVTEGAYGVPTAVEAVCGDGDLTVAICAEYDALPGLGHACGHNVIAAAGVGAALALAPVAEEAGLRVKLLGTPAEEHGGGKVDLLLAGAWEDVDFSMMAHGVAGRERSAGLYRSSAVERLEVVFHGQAAHAAAFPERAVNAGAAATLALTAIALLRQHVPADANLNAFISEAGEATNIIPGRSVLQVELRAGDVDVWRDLKRRALACFEGAATATGCTWEWKATEHPYAPVIPDPLLADLWDGNLEARGRELEVPTGKIGVGSTDMGNVTQVVPAIHASIGFLGEDAPAHTPEFERAAITPAADDAVMDAAVAMAWTALDVALDVDRRADLRRRTAERPAGATRTTLEA
jgi:amidohydrolase